MTISNILLTLTTISLLSVSGNGDINVEKRYQGFVKMQQEVEQIQDPVEKIIEYRKMRSKYKQFYTSPSFKEAFTKDEIRRICQTVETETYGADFESKTHVAEVIYARFESEKYGDTIKEIITHGQFAYWRETISEDTRLAAEYAYYFPSEVDGALHFHAGKAKTSWFGHPYITTDKAGHNFYGSKGW